MFCLDKLLKVLLSQNSFDIMKLQEDEKMKKLLILMIITVVFMAYSVKGSDIDMIYSETIDSINGVRYENHLVYYPDNGSDDSGANVWGYEVAVDKNNVVVESNSNVTMVRDGYILSAHGTKKVELLNVQVGDIVTVNLEALTVVISRDPIQSSYLQSLSNKEGSLIQYNLALSTYVTFDQERVSSLLTLINSDFTDLEEIYQSEEITASMETELVTLAYQIQRKTEEVFYRTTETKTIEIRAVWHRPNATSIKENNIEGIRSLLDSFESLGFNAIYVETFWNGYVSGRSDVLETHPNIASFYYGEVYGNDYLEAFITEANLRDIDVHAWVHTFNAGNATNLSSAIQEEWLLENYQGETLHPNTYGGSYYLDPSNPEVLSFVSSMLEDMIQTYNFAGMQLDYIRYYDNNYNLDLIRDSGYNDLANAKFKSEYGLTGDVRTLILDSQYLTMWNEWRQTNVTDAVEYFVGNLRAINPNIIISADVVGDISTARNTYMQDWLTWVRAGYIDLLCPMIYTGSTDRLNTVSKDIFQKIGNYSFLSSGIAPMYYGYSIMNQQEQLVIASQTGGSAIFASQNVIGNSQVEQSLKDGVFRNFTISPFASVDLIVTTVMDSIEDLLETNLIDQTIEDMFVDQINDIRLLSYNNPGDYQTGLNTITFMRQLSPYISDEVLSDVFSKELLALEHVLDVRITREMIFLGLYTPLDEERPNPLDFEYDSDVDLVDDPDDPVDPVDPVDPDDPDDNLPVDNETPDSEDIDNNEGLPILTYIIPVIVLFVTLSLTIVHISLKRRIL